MLTPVVEGAGTQVGLGRTAATDGDRAQPKVGDYKQGHSGHQLLCRRHGGGQGLFN